MNKEDIGYTVTAVAAGIDTFERRVSRGKGILGDEGLIPLYLGRDLIEERKYDSWSQVEDDLSEAARRIDGIEDGPRRMFLLKLMESLRTAVMLFQGEDLSFREKLVRLVGVPAEPIDGDFISNLAGKLDGDLNNAGFGRGTLRERVASWDESNRTAPEDLETTFRELMLEARDRTDAMVVPTGGYMMELNPVRNTMYTARCNFIERKMDLNVDNSFSRPALKHLVTHECFPGHSTQNIYTLGSFKGGGTTADVLLCSLNGITGVLQEGIGDQGVELIDWIEDINDEIQATLRRYQSAVATRGAWMLQVEHAPEEVVYEYLRDTGIMQEARIRGRITMARDPFRGPFIASYFYGNEAVRRVRRAVENDPVRRKAFIEELYGHMHSPESLCLSCGVEYRSYGDE